MAPIRASPFRLDSDWHYGGWREKKSVEAKSAAAPKRTKKKQKRNKNKVAHDIRRARTACHGVAYPRNTHTHTHTKRERGRPLTGRRWHRAASKTTTTLKKRIARRRYTSVALCWSRPTGTGRCEIPGPKSGGGYHLVLRLVCAKAESFPHAAVSSSSSSCLAGHRYR